MYFNYEALHGKIDAIRANNAWNRGLKLYAHELAEDLEEYEQDYNKPTNRAELKEILLNGAKDWKQYSWGGCSLIYDWTIVNRLGTPEQIKRYEKNLYNMANSHEQWLDVQARALYQAFELLCECLHI